MMPTMYSQTTTSPIGGIMRAGLAWRLRANLRLMPPHPLGWSA